MAKVVLNGAALATLLRGPNGEAAKALIVAGEMVKTKARGKLKAGFPADFLGPRLVKRIRPGPICEVGVEKPKTEPHEIHGNPWLVFPDGRDGTTVFLLDPNKFVHHPGSDFTKYLITILNQSLAEMRGVVV